MIGYASILRHRPETSGHNIWPVVPNLTSGIHCVVVFHLIYRSWIWCWTIDTEKQTHTIWKQIYMSANNINVIISGTTAIVRVWVIDAWGTNSSFLWLNWTPLVNWYALKIQHRNSEIEQHFSSTVSWTDILCSWLIFWLIVAYRDCLNGVTLTAYIKVQHFRIEYFFLRIFLWKKCLYYQY